jgi:DNA phosphorothioation-dependent restriction protein DptH
MAKRVNDEQRRAILRMLSEGHDRETIAAHVGVTPGQVSAIGAHVTMGTYTLAEESASQAPERVAVGPGTQNLLSALRRMDHAPAGHSSDFQPILLGEDAESHDGVHWNPDPAGGAANPHVLILGESGFGKTYTLCCLLAELARRGVTSIVFDYAQGFSFQSAPEGFREIVQPAEINASQNGIDINPLQPFPFDLHGPVSVAQRVADTFRRVYPNIGVQQHAVLRQAVIDAMSDRGILADNPTSWEMPLPGFGEVQRKLDEYSRQPTSPNKRLAAAVASHISTMFVFNTFRSNGHALEWSDMLNAGGQVYVMQLKGLEASLEKAVTEFLLWNFIGFIDSIGPGPLRCFVILDEAHKLSFDQGSPTEKLLREGRKFGLGVMLASQQPEDFSPVAFANTATKVVFQVGDDRSVVSRQLHRKIKNAHTFSEIHEIITKLPRGWAYVVSDNIGRVTRIESLEERAKRWQP